LLNSVAALVRKYRSDYQGNGPWIARTAAIAFAALNGSLRGQRENNPVRNWAPAMTTDCPCPVIILGAEVVIVQ
jgi:hypothetical protein